jgi:hypothetical protein
MSLKTIIEDRFEAAALRIIRASGNNTGLHSMLNIVLDLHPVLFQANLKLQDCDLAFPQASQGATSILSDHSFPPPAHL